MRSAIVRRTFLGRLAALPIFGAGGATFFARRADAATAAILRQVDEAERRCRDARQAFEDALATFEASFPEPHDNLIVDQNRWAITLVNERRLFDGEVMKRGRDRRGEPCQRSIATVASLNRDLTTLQPWEGGLGKKMRRLRRHAARHEIKVREAEDAYRLADLSEAVFWAERAVRDLAEAVFARPATTLPEIRVQARMLRVYNAALAESLATFQAGRYGATLAANLDGLAA